MVIGGIVECFERDGFFGTILISTPILLIYTGIWYIIWLVIWFKDLKKIEDWIEDYNDAVDEWDNEVDRLKGINNNNTEQYEANNRAI